MRHIHTSIVSKYLATRGSNEILSTPPLHISSSQEILPNITRHITRHTFAQLRKNKSLFLKSYLRKVNALTHSLLLCHFYNIHTHDTHHIFNCTHIHTTLSPLNLWKDPAEVMVPLVIWRDKLAGGPNVG